MTRSVSGHVDCSSRLWIPTALHLGGTSAETSEHQTGDVTNADGIARCVIPGPGILTAEHHGCSECDTTINSGKQILERDANENRHAEVVVVEERSKAFLWLAIANQELLIEREDRRDGEPESVPQAEL